MWSQKPGELGFPAAWDGPLMPQTSHAAGNGASCLCQRLSSPSSSAPLGLCPAVLAAALGEPCQPSRQTGLSCGDRQQPLWIKGSLPKVLPHAFGTARFVEPQQLPRPLPGFPKLGPGRICMKVPWFCALSLTSLHFLFSLWVTKRPLCDWELTL